MSTVDTPPEVKVARQVARDELSAILPPGSTLYAIERTVSRSGQSRTLDFYAMVGNVPRKITTQVATALDWNLTPRGTVVVRGWDGDSAFHVAQALSFALHGLVPHHSPSFRPGHTLQAVWL